GLAVSFFLTCPAEGGVDGNTVDPGGDGAMLLPDRNGSPYLDRYFLEEVVHVHSRDGIGPHYLEEQTFILFQPISENMFLFLCCHLSDALQYRSEERRVGKE